MKSIFQKTNHWQIAWRKKGDLYFSLVPNPSWGWCADPFLVEYKGDILLFAEIYLYKTERSGLIGYCKFENGKWSEWVVSMDRHWHLSFPNVWNDNGELYMCPESYQLGEVSIYRLNALPDQWAKVRTLISDVEYCDSVFLNYEGKKYMFTYERGEKGEPGKGLLCTIDNAGIREKGVFSMSPEGNRCGGKIIEDDGRLIRVAQNCKGEYGHGLILYEIDAVVPRYTEHEILRVFPKDIAGNFPYNITGVHTYNSLKDLEVIDLKHKNYSFREALARRRVKKVFLNKFR